MRVDRCHEVRRCHHGVAVKTRLARQQHGAPGRLPTRLDEEVGEGRMGLVGLRVRQYRLEVRDQFERAALCAGVMDGDGAQLGVVFGADEHRGSHVQVFGAGVELHLIGQEAGAVVPAFAGRGKGGDRREYPVADVAQVEERAVAVAQRVVAPARHVERSPAAHSGAIGAQRDGVAAVRQQVRRLETGRRRIDDAWLEHRQRFAFGRFRRCARIGAADDLPWRALVQQRHMGFDQRRAGKPAPRRVVAQHVAQRHQRHALVVRHEVAHDAERLAFRLPRHGEIDRVEEAAVAARTERFEQAQVSHRIGRRHQRRHRARIGRDHAVGRWRAAQGQARHTKGRVLVGQRVVLREVGRLGHAPGQLLRLAVSLLLRHSCSVGDLQQTVVGLGHDERRHQVLEHRARPRLEAGARTDRQEGASECHPVAARHVALGDGQEAEQARLRSQQVVVALVERVVVDPQADVEQVALGVVQALKIHGGAQRLAALGDRFQRVRRCSAAGSSAGILVCKGAAGLCHSQQVPRHVAAVYARHIGRRHRSQRLRVVPVVEMALMFVELVDGV